MSDENKTINGWNEWSKYVLNELKQHHMKIEEIRDTLHNIELNNLQASSSSKESIANELNTLNTNITDSINKVKNELSIEITKLKVKSGYWGTLGGLAVVSVAVIIWLIKLILEI